MMHSPTPCENTKAPMPALHRMCTAHHPRGSVLPILQEWKLEDKLEARSDLPQVAQPIHRSPDPRLPGCFPALSLEGSPAGERFIRGAFVIPSYRSHLTSPPSKVCCLYSCYSFPSPFCFSWAFPRGCLQHPC